MNKIQLTFNYILVALIMLFAISCEKEYQDEFYVTANVFYMTSHIYPTHNLKYEVNSEGYIIRKSIEVDRIVTGSSVYIYDQYTGVVTTEIKKDKYGVETSRDKKIERQNDGEMYFSDISYEFNKYTYTYLFNKQGRLTSKIEDIYDNLMELVRKASTPLSLTVPTSARMLRVTE